MGSRQGKMQLHTHRIMQVVPPPIAGGTPDLQFVYSLTLERSPTDLVCLSAAECIDLRALVELRDAAPELAVDGTFHYLLQEWTWDDWITIAELDLPATREAPPAQTVGAFAIEMSGLGIDRPDEILAQGIVNAGLSV